MAIFTAGGMTASEINALYKQADGVYMQIKDFEVLAGQERYIIINNISKLPFRLNEILLFSTCPNPHHYR